MSTTKIREVLDAVVKAAHINNEWDGPVKAAIILARAEVEAIEKAAGEVRVWGIGPVLLPSATKPTDEYRAELETRRLWAYSVLSQAAQRNGGTTGAEGTKAAGSSGAHE